MALAAVITEPLISAAANTYYFAGYSYARLHGYASTLDGSSHEIDDYLFCTSDYNHFYSTAGDGSGTNGLFMIGSTNKTFPGWQAMPFDTHVVFGADPLFTNPGIHDFTISATSPCRNVGSAQPMVCRDFFGYFRAGADGQIDKGAYEYGATPGGGGTPIPPPPPCGDRLATFMAAMREVY